MTTICANCHRILKPDGSRTGRFLHREDWGEDTTHGICLPCVKVLYGEQVYRELQRRLKRLNEHLTG